MAVRPQYAFIDARVVPFAEATLPLDDRGLQFGESLYEVLPITAGKPRLLSEHVARMQQAATELGIEAGVPNVTEWERIISELVKREGFKDGLLYAQLTGGSAPRDFVPANAPAPRFFAYAVPCTYPGDAQVVRGIRAITVPDIRWSRRDLKTTMLLAAVLAKREAKRRGVDDALLVGPEGHVHEGASSNVFIVEGNALVTPVQSPNLLPGTMRPLVSEVAREAGYEVRGEPLSIVRVAKADEAFITSTSQLVMPIVSLDDLAIGDGRAGEVTRDSAERLRTRFELTP